MLSLLSRTVAFLAVGGGLVLPIVEGRIVGEAAKMLKQRTAVLGLPEVETDQLHLVEIGPEPALDAAQRGLAGRLLDADLRHARASRYPVCSG
jgi:hypothetical protein